jgi:hypothetical protein
MKHLPLILFFLLSAITLQAQCEWAVSGGSGHSGYTADGVKVKHDLQGNIYVAGQYDSVFTFLGSTVLNLYPGGKGVLIARLNSNGTLNWLRHVESFNMNVEDIAVRGGELYLVGHFQNNITIAGVNFSGQGINGIFLKFDATGNLVWGRTANSPSSSFISAIEFVDDNTFLFAGRFRQSISITGNVISGSNPNFTYCVYGAMTSAGQLVWSRTSGEGGNLCQPTALGLLPGGDFLMGGIYRQGLVFGSITAPLPTANLANLPFLGRFSSSGVPIWLQAGNAPSGFGTSAVTDIQPLLNGQVMVTGGLAGNVTFLGATNPSGHAAFAMRCQPANGMATASHLVQSATAGNRYDFAEQDQAGNIWIGGRARGPLSIINNGSTTQTGIATGNFDMIMTYFEGGTNYLGLRVMGGPHDDHFGGASLDNQGRLVTTGGFAGNIQLLNTNLQSSPGNTPSLFVARFCSFAPTVSTASPEWVTETLHLWPNPARDQVFVQMPRSMADYHFTLFDATGRILSNGVVQGLDTWSLDVSTFSRGMATLRLSTADSQWIGRLLLVD